MCILYYTQFNIISSDDLRNREVKRTAIALCTVEYVCNFYTNIYKFTYNAPIQSRARALQYISRTGLLYNVAKAKTQNMRLCFRSILLDRMAVVYDASETHNVPYVFYPHTTT